MVWVQLRRLFLGALLVVLLGVLEVLVAHRVARVARVAPVAPLVGLGGLLGVLVGLGGLGGLVLVALGLVLGGLAVGSSLLVQEVRGGQVDPGVGGLCLLLLAGRVGDRVRPALVVLEQEALVVPEVGGRWRVVQRVHQVG